jgi:hypothetical protein
MRETTKSTTKKRQRKKARYHVKNWAEYDRALQQRGSLTVWLSDEAIQAWAYHGPRTRGGQRVYSALAIETALTLRAVYHLPLRQTEGFMASVVELVEVEIPIPDHTTLSRRAAELAVVLPVRKPGESVYVVVDSTGVKVYGEGEWKVRQHGVSKRRTWRKLHFAVDEATGDIVAETLTENSVDDGEQVSPLMAQVESSVGAFGGDGAYDKQKVYDTLRDRADRQHHALAIKIPPRQDAKIWQHGNCQSPPHPRDENLRYIRKHGRKKWKRECGYHRRSLAETTVFRYKRMIGEKLGSRRIETQRTEARIGCKVLNRMTTFGMPNSYKLST